MFLLRQSTAVDIKLGPFVDKTDGVAYETGMAAAMDHATTGVRLSKNGAAFADRNEGTQPAYDAFGYYLVKLDTTDTNTVGRLKVIFGDAAVCLPCEANFQVLEEAAYDALFAASAAGFDANQRVNVGQWLSQAVTLSTGNKPDVNVDEISDDATAPVNLEAAYDGAGYAGGTIKPKVDLETIKTQAVTCGAGVTVLASVGTAATSTAQTGDSYAIVNGASGLVAIKSQTGAIETDTQDIQSRVPAALTANGNIKASLLEILTTALTETAGLLAGGFKKFFNVAAPTATCLSLPDAAPGANGGLPTTNGTKVSQTVDLTVSQIVFKKNVARANFAFPMFDSAGALKTGLTVAAAIRKDAGASFAALAGSVTEIGTTGWYTVDWAQAETNADTIAFSASAAGAVPTCYTILTQA